MLAAAITGAAACADAAPSSDVDMRPSLSTPAPGESVEIGTVKPLPDAGRSARRDAPPPSGNPLWSIPLSTLKATQDRPLFSASRRPPPRAVAAPPVEATVVPVAAPPPPPERPMLALIGAVVGEGEAIAIFTDQAGSGVVRMRAGDNRSGWVLEAVAPREVTLRKGDQTEVLTIQRQAVAAQPVIDPTQMAPPPGFEPRPYVPYAPFVPRSTPKNGESDGL